METVKERIKKDTVSANIHCPQADGTYTVRIEWSPRMSSLDVPQYSPTRLCVGMTLEEIEKLGRDLLRVVLEVQNGKHSL